VGGSLGDSLYTHSVRVCGSSCATSECDVGDLVAHAESLVCPVSPPSEGMVRRMGPVSRGTTGRL
jgi:hypothetical protein